MKRILILGGYGNFGKRIAVGLSQFANCHILIAGRSRTKAEDCCKELSRPENVAEYEPVVLDINNRNLAHQLAQLKLDLCIHTSGPFQDQDHRVAQACIEAGSHYLDLADDRRFVCDIKQLDSAAKQSGLVVVSGASTVPGLSSVVIDRFAQQFSILEEIDFSIVPGNQASDGTATLRGVLSNAGRSFISFRDGEEAQSFGWGNPRIKDFGKILGKRWLADLDIPDVELFPLRYLTIKTLRFQAGQELSLLHLSLHGFSQLRRAHLLPSLAMFTSAFQLIADCFKPFGTDLGGHVDHSFRAGF